MNRLNILRATIKDIIDVAVKSEVLADTKSTVFCKNYLKLASTTASTPKSNESKSIKIDIFNSLCMEHGLKVDKIYNKLSSLVVNKQLDEFKNTFNFVNYDKLDKQLKPDYYLFFKCLARVHDGVQTVVKLRQDLLEIIENNESSNLEQLRIMNGILKELLSLWFSTGLLKLHRITWESPSTLVEKVAHFESVHPIRSLTDLKTRLGYSRRCYIFTHSSMPFEPLVILHIALTHDLVSNIGTLIRNLEDNRKETDDNRDATQAIFYSVNSCQKGLKKVDLGNSLIKSCVSVLQQDIPSLKHFDTLSPIPGFRTWLNLKLDLNNQNEQDKIFNVHRFLKSNELYSLMTHFEIDKSLVDVNKYQLFKEKLKNYLNSEEFRRELFDGTLNNEIKQIFANFLQRVVAFYLYHEKRRGFALNSVCNFHLRNGAKIGRINYAADQTDRGWKSSYCLMINYNYNLTELDSNCLNYLNERKISVSESVNNLLNFNSVSKL